MSLSTQADISISGGRYYVSSQPDAYFLQYHTALAAAVNDARQCDCVVTVTQPEVQVTVRPDTVNVRIIWEAMPDAAQYQLMIGTRLLEFDVDVTSFITEVQVGTAVRVRYSNTYGAVGEWSDAAVIVLP